MNTMICELVFKNTLGKKKGKRKGPSWKKKRVEGSSFEPDISQTLAD